VNCIKVGNLIKVLRHEKNMTQKQLADKMNISDKAISKWERGLGCPDVSLLAELSSILEVNIEEMLKGDLSLNNFVGGNMKKSKYYVCPVCGNITLCTGNAVVSCCGRKLEALEMKKANDEQKLIVEQVEDEWFITSNHPMNKETYISFVAFATGNKIQIIKHYPEWDMQMRIQKREHGFLIWYSTKQGLLYQLI
jgi:DNA-binding XRE family transcriptional regulator